VVLQEIYRGMHLEPTGPGPSRLIKRVPIGLAHDPERLDTGLCLPAIASRSGEAGGDAG
jgi:hypothetical protein